MLCQNQNKLLWQLQGGINVQFLGVYGLMLLNSQSHSSCFVVSCPPKNFTQSRRQSFCSLSGRRLEFPVDNNRVLRFITAQTHTPEPTKSASADEKSEQCLLLSVALLSSKQQMFEDKSLNSCKNTTRSTLHGVK